MAPLNGTSTSPNTPAVLGDATLFEGVRGISHAAGHGGVVGLNVEASSNAGPGVYGSSDHGEGVRGINKSNDHGAVVGTNSAAGAGVYGESSSGEGVRGIGHSADHGAVVGTNSATGAGVYGESSGGEGVRGVGHSADHGAVVGSNDSGTGVFGVSQAGEGVHGETNSPRFVAGVTGVALNNDGVGPGVLGQSNGSGPGVFGKAQKDAGVTGFHGDPRLQETTVANDGGRAGVFGASDIGAGLVGYSRNTSSFGVIAFGGIRASAMDHPTCGEFNGKVQVNGDIQVAGDIFLQGADCAEHFDVIDCQGIEPGSVLVIDEGGALRQSEHPYDKKVAGVVSGAGSYRAGIVLDKQQSQENRLAVALVGKVYCKVDAQYSPIAVGDLLTTSPTPGYAMKAADPLKAFGTVIGKALRPLGAGQGLIPILVALQ